MTHLQQQPSALRYKGSPRHKLWGPHGAGGSLCPEWTHDVKAANDDGNKGDVDKHPWSETLAQQLLNKSVLVGKKRYATARNVAFCAQPSNDGTWHGYPVSWNEVPVNVQRALINNREVTRADIRRQMRRDKRARQ